MAFVFALSPAIDESFVGSAEVKFEVPIWSRESVSAIRDVALTRDGDGWAVGDDGLIARIEGENWTVEHASTLVRANLLSIALDETGGGWAVGGGGAVLRLQDGVWTMHPQHTQLTTNDALLTKVLLTPDGSVAWLTDGTKVWIWRGESWRQRDSAPPSPYLRAPGMYLGNGGALHVVADNHIFTCPPENECRRDIADVTLGAVVARDGEEVLWAADKQRIGLIGERLGDYGATSVRPVLGPIHQIFVREKARTPGPHAWAIGDMGQILALTNGQWIEHEDSRRITRQSIRRVAISSSGGWAVTERGNVLRLKHPDGRWEAARPLPGISLVDPVDPADRWPNPAERRDIHIDEKGSAWLLADTRLYVWRAERGWEPASPVLEGTLARPHVTALAVAKARRHGWAAADQLLELRDDTWHARPDATALLRGRAVSFLWESTDADHAVAAGNMFLLEFRDGSWAERYEGRVASPSPDWCSYEHSTGTLLMRQEHEYFRVTLDGQQTPAFTVPEDTFQPSCDTVDVGGTTYVKYAGGVVRRRNGNWEQYAETTRYMALDATAKSGVQYRWGVNSTGSIERAIVFTNLGGVGPDSERKIDCREELPSSSARITGPFAGYYSASSGLVRFDASGCRRTPGGDLLLTPSTAWSRGNLAMHADRDGWWSDSTRGLLLSLRDERLRPALPVLLPRAISTEGRAILLAGRAGGIVTRPGDVWVPQTVIVQGAADDYAVEDTDWNDATIAAGRQWLVGTHGTIVRSNGDIWQRVPGSPDVDLYGISIQDGKGWVVGSESTVLGIVDGIASLAPVKIPKLLLHGVDLNKNGDGWIVGHSGTILRLENGAWQVVPSTGEDLTAVALEDARSSGWIVGRNGRILRIIGSNVFLDGRASALAKEELLAVGVTSDGSRGWAAGRQTVLRVDRVQQTLRMQHRIAFGGPTGDGSLAAKLLITLEFPPEFRCEHIEVVDQTGDVKPLYPAGCGGPASERTLGGLRPGDALVITARVSDPERAYLAAIAVPSDPIVVPGTLAVDTDGDADSHDHRSSELLFALPALPLGLLVILVLLSPRWGPARAVATSPRRSKILGLFVGWYLVSRPMFLYIRSLRIRLFDGYRRGFIAAPRLDQWSGLQFAPIALKSAENVSTPHDDLFTQILARGPGLVHGLSGGPGSGKTALLEQWTRFGVKQARVPLLTDLGEPETMLRDIAEKLRSYGQIHFDTQTLQSVIQRGGFILLLDKYPPHGASAETQKWLREVARINIVVLAGRTPPIPPELCANQYEIASDVPRMSRLSTLVELFVSLTANADGLLMLLKLSPVIADIEQYLPAPSVPLASAAMASAELLIRHGRAAPTLFNYLVEKYPQRKVDIRNAAVRFGVELAQTAE